VPRASLLIALLLAGCVPQVGPPVDGGDSGGGGGTGGAGGGTGGAQGGGTGGGTPTTCSDGVRDGDETALDCGGSCAPCANGSGCLSPLDCQSGVCAGTVCGPPANDCGGAFAGCTAFTDLSAPSATRTVTFGSNHVYVPRCIRVRFGQQVTFAGSFGTHPMQQACGPATALLQNQSGTTFTVTMDQALGVFGYYCNVHGTATGSGMAGAIEVVR
jgi:plastocyanin